MKKQKHNIFTIIIVFALILFSNSFTHAMEDLLHPKVELKDINGNLVFDKSSAISMEKTCGQCHDTQYINHHNYHFTTKVKANCIQCHFKDGKMAGDYNEAHKRIQQPSNQNCAQCHGIIHTRLNPLAIPPDYTERIQYKDGESFYDITQTTGAILAPQDLSISNINLKDKKNQHFPWDIHSRRQLDCISCHFTKNNPRYCGNIRTPLDHLIRDPRKIAPPYQYLKYPNHELLSANCTCCHDPFKAHPNLPYKKRHMEVLNCQSCHIPRLYGPALQAVDKTVLNSNGQFRFEYRGTDDTQSHGTSLNTKYFEGFIPFLFSFRSGETKYKITPFNLVTQWYWKSNKTGEPVSDDILRKIYQKNNPYPGDILKLFDKDKNSTLTKDELILDSEDKINLIKSKLLEKGIQDPVIAGTIKSYPINHGVLNAKHMKRDCSACHSIDSNFGREILLSSMSPIGTTPTFPKDGLPYVNGEITTNEKGELILKRASNVEGRYILGHGRIKWLDTAGIWIFSLSLLMIFLHGAMRYYSSLKVTASEEKVKGIYMYGGYERLWHWTMATAIILLGLTGLEIHYTGTFKVFGLLHSVSIHNVIATILVINAFLSLFFHIATGEIKQFFGFNRKFLQETIVQAFYYISGIFKRSPHPIPKTKERKLNPLQQLTYIFLLNILLPFQMITGILMWSADKWPQVANQLGGLTLLAPIHNLGSWLMLSFLVVHVYLTTTGHSLFSNIKAMITGYDEITEEEADEEQQRYKEMKLMDLTRTLLRKLSKKNQLEKEEESE
jgi:thiosulfate reductase cytochrome b subunit